MICREEKHPPLFPCMFTSLMKAVQYIRDFCKALSDITVILLGRIEEHKDDIYLESVVLTNFYVEDSLFVQLP